MQLMDLHTCRTTNWSVGASGRYWPRRVKSVSDEVEHWSLTVLHSKFIECDAKVIPVATNERLKCSVLRQQIAEPLDPHL